MKGVNPMKKVLCLVLVLVLCMVSVALASSSPTIPDITKPDVEAKAENGKTVKIIIQEDNASAAQLRVLQATPVKDDFFGDIQKEEGGTAKLSELLDPADINEFATIIVEDYDPDYGAVTAKITFKTTKYNEDDKIFVLIGLQDGALYWSAFEGKVVDNQGSIQVVFPADVMEKIQAGNGLIAIASQSAPVAETASAGSSGAPATDTAPAEDGASAGSPGAPAGNEE